MSSSTQNDMQSRQNNSKSTIERSSPDTDDAERSRQPLPPPLPLSFALLPEDITITRKELDIMKLTAQFVVVYGMYFKRDLMKSLSMKPQVESHFQFLKSTDSKYHFYLRLSLGFSRLLLRSEKLRENGANNATVFEAFFNLLCQTLEKEQEGGVEMAMTDLRAFECIVNLEYSYWRLPPENLSMRINSPSHMQPPLGSPDIQLDAPNTDDAERSLQPPPPQLPLIFASLPEGIRITHKELDIMKLTAQFVAVFGMYFQGDLVKSLCMNPQFESHFQFLKATDSRYHYYFWIALVYSKVLFRSEKLRERSANRATVLEGFFNLLRQVLEKEEEEGVEIAMTDLLAFEYIVNMEHSDWRPPPRNLSMMMNPPPQMQSHDIQPDALAIDDAESHLQPPPLQKPLSFALLFEGITILPKELDIIKLTAQFVAVRGMDFWQDLIKTQLMKTQFESLFEFMNSTDTRHKFFAGLVLQYRKELMPSENLRKDGASTAAVIGGFFSLLRQVLKQEVDEGVEMGRNDLHAFDSFVNNWRMMMNPPPQMQPFASRPGMSHPPPLVLPEEPYPKRQKFDESTLVPEDQFIAQHPGSSTIRVSVPHIDDGKVIEITVQSLLENVASLKEKIAGEIQIPSNEQKLSGKAGFLKDNMSLAHYNVGAGEILTLSL